MPQDKPLIFIDTCSYLDSSWLSAGRNGDDLPFDSNKDHQFWEVEVPKLTSMGRVILPQREFEELKKHSRNKERGNLSDRAKIVMEKLDPLVQSKKIEIFGDANDPFADATLLSIALRFRTQRNLLFVTQDRRLAADLKAIRDFQSVEPRHDETLEVKRIHNTSGKIENHFVEATTSTAEPKHTTQKAQGSFGNERKEPMHRGALSSLFRSRNNQTSQTDYDNHSQPKPIKRKSWWES